MSILVGLTGSIGMGKSTTAQMFRDEGTPVWDADEVVHRIYDTGGAAVPLIEMEFPEAVENGRVLRPRLREIIAQNPSALTQIEAIVHPIVAADRAQFMETATAEVIIFDIPLLFEAGYETWLDVVICVTAPSEVQRDRVLSRTGMTQEAFDAMLAKQMPDAQKRARADYVIETITLEETRDNVRRVLADIKQRFAHA